MTLVGSIVITLGSLLLVVAAWGVLRLPDALARQHAATKAGTLALLTICLGAALLAPAGQGFGWRLAVVVALLFGTLPVASHLLARAAVREARPAGVDEARRVGDRPRGP